MNRRFGGLSSSANPQALGETVKAGILGASVLIIYLSKTIFGVDVLNAQITDFAVAAGTAVTSLWVVFGVLQKVFIALYDKFAQRG